MNIGDFVEVVGITMGGKKVEGVIVDKSISRDYTPLKCLKSPIYRISGTKGCDNMWWNEDSLKKLK